MRTIAALLALAALLPAADPAPRFAWQDPQCQIVADGPVELRWTPKPFAYIAGKTERHIDPVAGDDANPGSREKPWKHHPWDAAATGLAKSATGVDTYVFKRGTVYRGQLVARDSGTAGAPIRLTSDPAWGSGEAVLSATTLIEGGWELVADVAAAGLPEKAAGQVWSRPLPGRDQTTLAWAVAADGSRQRLTLARTPNAKPTDPLRPELNAYRWQDVQANFTTMTGKDGDHLDGPAGSFVGATVWTDEPAAEFAWNAPSPSRITAFDPATSSVTFLANHPGKHPKKGSRYWLENLPAFLNSPGEWVVAKDRLYLWPADGGKPPAIELGDGLSILELGGRDHIEVSGLTFRGAGACGPAEYNTRREGGSGKPWLSESMGAIRIHGAATGIGVRACRFTQLPIGISASPAKDGDVLDLVQITDSDFADLDEGGICLSAGTEWRDTPMGRIERVRVLRNRVQEVGLRTVSNFCAGIFVGGGSLLEVAGNIIHRCGGQGINVFAGKIPGGVDSQMKKQGARPLIRTLIHHNQASETLLAIQDFGGIESWGGGPAYLFSNISATPVGWIRHNDWYHKNEAFYLDHQFKGYLFNNIGWSIERADGWEGLLSADFLMQAQGQATTVFHNTAYRFRTGCYSDHKQGMGDRDAYLGNLFLDVPNTFGHAQLAGNTTYANAANVIAGKNTKIFSLWNSHQLTDVAALTAMLDQQKAAVASVGWRDEVLAVRDAPAHDFRPLAGSSVIDRGVKVFVPWGLYATAGEWHFNRHRADPTVVVGEAFPITADHVQHGDFHQFGRLDLRVAGATAADFATGTLEDWTDGALTLDGKRTAVAELSKPNVPGSDLDRGDGGLVVEAVLRATSSGVIASKLDASGGYVLRLSNGKPELMVRSAGGEAVVTGPAAIADGAWHHVLAEVDTISGELRLHVDGRTVATAKAATVLTKPSACPAVFTVGQGLVGALDFLRVARGSLADAQTTIAELYAWQTAGPQTRDFAGKPFSGKARDVGALEAP